MDPLFPELPEDLSAVSDEDLSKLLEDHESAKEAIRADDEEFLKGLSADEIIEQLTAGVSAIKVLEAEVSQRGEAHQNFVDKKAEILAELEASEDEGGDDEGDGDEGEEADAPAEVVAEVEETEEVAEAEPVLVTASVTPRYSRTPPPASLERQPVAVVAQETGTALVAAGEMSLQYREPLTESTLAEVVKAAAIHHGKHPKIDPPGKYRFGGPEHKIARADFDFPEERTLSGDPDELVEKFRAILPETQTFLGKPGQLAGEALVASGGLCAPLTPIYSMPNFATEAEPVWDSLPVFRAARGGVNSPEATYIADIETAISSISEEEDALGGTFATKSCQDLECPDYTEVAVQILAHCREYGNLNARAWPEKIAHENALTMAALSRTTEQFMLDRIKALSVNVTQAAVGTQYGAFASLVHAIAKASAGVKFRLRMPRTSTFRVLLPSWIPDMLAADNAAYAFDRFLAQSELEARLSQYRITVTYYLDDVTGGTSQGFAAEAAGALDEFPDDVQYALYAEGAFLGIDSGVLELGIVRDSVLNATNDFQVFGERFRNLTRIGPAQSALWVTQDICPTGSPAAAATANSC